MSYFKRYFNETSGHELTDDWGTSTYYFETDEKGVVSKQLEVYLNSKVLKYSNLQKEDAYGGMSLVPLDLKDKSYEKISAKSFKELFNRTYPNEYLGGPLHVSDYWQLGWVRFRYNMTEEDLKNEGSIIALKSVDKRFTLNVDYDTEKYKFFIQIFEGSVVIFYHLFEDWREVVAATNHWLWEIENTAKNWDIIPSDELSFPMQIVINQDLQICLLTTWRNSDWGVNKLRNVELRSNEGVIFIEETFGFLEEILQAIQKQLPEDQFIRSCTFCQFATYETNEYAYIGDLLCMKNCKKQFLKIKTLRGFKGLLEREKDYISKVNETHLCDQFERLDGLNWTFKDTLIETGL
jgi:hypothetical protein